ncbi:hypothetical protein BKA70DRAFT_680408 [Coprinopsis sp. MPI-PUGE-AT-0042]|nr:hypothetical protein BKA70DRAFT_680408 [Coprinopsis sp. MPI-PUGE-AT-0042]
MSASNVPHSPSFITIQRQSPFHPSRSTTLQMYQEASRLPSDPVQPAILPPSPSRDGSRASFWSDDSSYSISNSPSTSSITAGSLTNSYICRLDEWAEGEDPIEDAPPSYRAAGQGCDADVPPPSTSPHPHPCSSQSSSLSVQRSAVPSNSLPPDAASPKVENGPRTSGVFSSDASTQVTISTPSPLIDCFPAALLSGLVHRTSIHRRATSLDSLLASKHWLPPATHPLPFASLAGVITDGPSPTSSSASQYSLSPSTSSITSSTALCGRLVTASSVMNSRHRHPFTYCPTSPSSVSSSVHSTRRNSRSSTTTIQPNCSSVSEKELRRRRLLKLTKTLGEEIPPELVVGTVGPREGLSRRALEHSLSGAPAIEQSYMDPRRQTHKKATSSILFPTYDGSNSLLNALLSTSSSRSNTGYVNSLDREDVAKRQHAGWGGGVGSGFGSLARHCREKHRRSKDGRDGKSLRGDNADDPEKRHSIVKPGTLLHPRPVLVPSASHDGASVGLGKSSRKARGALLDVMVESTSCEEVVAYFEDHPFRVGDGTGPIRDSSSPAITPLPAQPASAPAAEAPATSTPVMQATPLLHRSVAGLRPPLPPFASISFSINVK